MWVAHGDWVPLEEGSAEEALAKLTVLPETHWRMGGIHCFSPGTRLCLGLLELVFPALIFWLFGPCWPLSQEF